MAVAQHLETLQIALEKELVARECSHDSARNNRHPQDKPRPPPTATTLLSGTQESSGGSVACCYCALGFLAPVIIRFKFKKLCEQQLQWDEALPDALQEEWEALVEDLHDSGLVSIPRSHHQERPEVHSSVLCGFRDASTTAYAAVVYLVLKTQRNTHIQFLVAKTRVAPM